MNDKQAWELLGYNSKEIFENLSSMTKEKRIVYSLDILNDLKSKYKVIMAKNHPDRGGSHEKFVNVQKAYDHMIKSTEEFVDLLKKKIRNEEKESMNRKPSINIKRF